MGDHGDPEEDYGFRPNPLMRSPPSHPSPLPPPSSGLLLGPPGTGKSHLAQAIGRAAIQQGYRVIYREAHTLLEELTEATLAGTRKEYVMELATVPLLIIDDLGMRKLAHTAAEDLLELIMRRYERASTLLTSNRLCGAAHNRFNAQRIVMPS